MIKEEDWSHDRLISILKSTKDLEIVKDNGKQILVKTLSAEPFFELFKLGVSAYWCFTDPKKEKREKYYQEYVKEGCEQYILFNLEKVFVHYKWDEKDLSCVAFTTEKGFSKNGAYPNIFNGTHIIFCYNRPNRDVLHSGRGIINEFINTLNQLGYCR